MIYLLHPDGTIAACETETSAARAEARGYARCSYEEWRDGWIDRDVWALALLRSEARGRRAERAVGDAPGKPEQLAGLPIGMKRYWTGEGGRP